MSLKPSPANYGERATEIPLPTCAVSRSSEAKPLCQVNGFQVWRCPSSATDFVWPKPTDTIPKVDPAGDRIGNACANHEASESVLNIATALLDRFTEGAKKLSVLDVACGYGTCLRLAADKRWKCFGIEPSAHAREVAAKRHGNRINIVERAEDLLPQRFDLIFMFEALEHLTDPYPLFFTLFGRDAIGPETLVVITTPNARSHEAIANPSGWAYRNPPSRLVFYSARSLEILLRRLMFKSLHLAGIEPLPSGPASHFDDEAASLNDELGGFLGLVAEAKGSDFKEFMHERYVPGAFWKLTEYEHLPRYALAGTLANGKRVLDFGCGTGYGSAILAEVAVSVVGLDISTDAIEWAKAMHRNPRLAFELRSDLGRGLPPASFDLVTCFEMIEHVDFEMQQATIQSIAKLLTPEGKLVISTPDPRFTADYGNNPYHLREMSEAEFMELLQPCFRQVTMLKQWVRPSILIGTQTFPGLEPVVFGPLEKHSGYDSLVGFVAICSNQAFSPPPHFCQFDTTTNFNRKTLETEHQLNRLRFENQCLLDGKALLESQAMELNRVLAETRTWVDTLIEGKNWLEGQVNALEAQLQELDHVLEETRAWLKEREGLLAETQAVNLAQSSQIKRLLEEVEHYQNTSREPLDSEP